MAVISVRKGILKFCYSTHVKHLIHSYIQHLDNIFYVISTTLWAGGNNNKQIWLDSCLSGLYSLMGKHSLSNKHMLTTSYEIYYSNFL